VKYEFRWNEWNVEHISAHDITPGEAEFVVDNARRPFPQAQGQGKFLVAGQTADGSYIQVIYIFSPRDVVFVIHARPLNDSEKHKFRRRIR
jgi:uncharacterized DUF497 family protein